jgi:hypothetical protein
MAFFLQSLMDLHVRALLLLKPRVAHPAGTRMTDAIDKAAVTAISTISTTAIPIIFRRTVRLTTFRPLQVQAGPIHVQAMGAKGRILAAKSTARHWP